MIPEWVFVAVAIGLGGFHLARLVRSLLAHFAPSLIGFGPVPCNLCMGTWCSWVLCAGLYFTPMWSVLVPIASPVLAAYLLERSTAFVLPPVDSE